MKFKLPWTVCRVCLREGQMFSLFQKDAVGMSIAEKLTLVAEIKVIPDKNLPEEICRRCMILLNSAHQFQIQCKKSDFLLHMSVKHKAQNEQGSKQHAVILTLNNGKIFTISKDVTVKTRSSLLAAEVVVQKSEAKKQQFGEKSDDQKAERKNFGSSNSNLSVHQRKTRSQDSNNVENYTADDDDVNSALEIEEIGSPSAQDDFHITDDTTIDQCEQLNEIEEGATVSSCSESPKKKQKAVEPPQLPTSSSKRIPAKRSPTCVTTLKHVIKEAEDNGKVFICEFCGNKYESKTGFDIHMRFHRNERPYECEICHAAFVQSCKLTAHMRKHTGEKPYKCEFCSRQFSKKESKLLHERMHTGEKPYECDICNKKFSYACVLVRHKLIHTDEEKSFICAPCGKRFRFKYHLNAHLKTSLHQLS